MGAWEDAVLALSPDSYWKADEASAAGGAVDEIGAANGTYDGSGVTYSEPSLVPSDSGTSVKFDDTIGGAINVSDIYDFTANTSFTALCWGKLETFNAVNGHFIFCKRRTAPTHDGWSLALNPAAITITASRIIADEFQEAVHTVSEASLEGSSHMYGIQYDGTNVSVILDGALFGAQVSPSSIAGHTVALTLGKFSDGGGSTWDGWLDELAIWTPSLTTQNIADLYEAGIASGVAGRIYKRLFGPAHLGSSAATLYTAPSGGQAIIRQIFANNPSGSPVDVTLSIGVDGATTRIVEEEIPAGGALNWRRPANHTLAAGEVLQGFASSAATVVLTVNGVENTL